MHDDSAGEWRALQALQRAGVADADLLVALLREAGVGLVDRTLNPMLCRWVPVTERPVPPEADTLIRTITRTEGDRTTVRSYWLEGLRGPLD